MSDVPKCNMDHLVIAAKTLGAGVEFVKEKFGVDVPKGGEHRNMATHNHVMQLGDDIFLEIISVAPELEGNPDYVSRPRWFALDEPAMQHKLEKQPSLVAWVVNTGDLEGLTAACPFSLGTVTPVSRGDLNWLFALPADGRLLAGGALPYVMQWLTQDHPSRGMKDLGVRLKSLTIAHLYPDWLARNMELLGVAHLVEIVKAPDASGAGMTARFETPATSGTGGNREVVLTT